MDSISLELQKLKGQSSKETAPVDDILNDVKTKFQQQKPKPKTGAKTDFILNNLKSQYEQKGQVEGKERQKQQLEEIQQKELLRQRKRKAIARKAREWLNNLDPMSEEGFWFEEFSSAYDSKLEAAIDYLQALDNS